MPSLKLSFILLLPAFTCLAQDFTLVQNDPSTVLNERSYGASLVDIDNDGDLDIYATCVVNNFNELYISNANGSFGFSAPGQLTGTAHFSEGVSWSDLDNDGDLDCFVANHAQNNELFINNQGVFEVIQSGNIVNDLGFSRSGVWGDYDSDGCIDLYVTNQQNTVNFLYKNKCDGSFERIISGPMANDEENSIGCSWTDMDNDGDLDCLVLNQGQHNTVYVNYGAGNFTRNDTCALSTTESSDWNVGASWGDMDNDGDLDLYVTVHNNKNRLFRNEGNFHFIEITGVHPVYDNQVSTGSTWFDMENDGDQDLVVGNDDGQVNRIYLNDGEANFSSSINEISSETKDSRSIVAGDIDADGFQDLYIANEFSGNSLLINNGNNNTWANVGLTGIQSNRAAIGAKVRLKANIFGVETWQFQEITSQTGYLGQGSLNAEFGLGNATMIDSVIITWPSMDTCYFVNLAINQHYFFSENCDPVTTRQLKNQTSCSSLFPNPTTGIVNYEISVEEPILVEVIDLFGKVLQTESNSGVDMKTIALEEGIPNGVYGLKLSGRTQMCLYRFILNR